MKTKILKIIGYTLMVVGMVWVCAVLFRSETPMYWFFGLAICIAILVMFPYEKLF